MNTSTHYNLKLAEGTDLVNPLNIDVPNYQTIDATMFANEQAGVGTATELKSGTIHAITRTNQNRNVFTFKSTSVFNVGDTFTVDGSNVTALYPDNSSLKERCFIVGSEVMCMLDGSQLTVLATYYPEAENVIFDNSDTSLSSTNVQNAIEELTNSDNIKFDSTRSVKDMITFFNSIIPYSTHTGQTDITFNGYSVKIGKIIIVVLDFTSSVSSTGNWKNIVKIPTTDRVAMSTFCSLGTDPTHNNVSIFAQIYDSPDNDGIMIRAQNILGGVTYRTTLVGLLN